MMKKIISLFIVLSILLSVAGCTSNSNSDEKISSKEDATSSEWSLSDVNSYYGDTFGQGNIIDVNVEVAEEDWQAILDNPIAEEFYPADITVNGTTVENVGFRVKGFSSLTSVAKSDSDRYGFKVKTDKYEEGQTLNGFNC